MKPRILIAEDEDKMRRILEIMLSQDGYQIDPVRDGAGAMSLSEKFGYDLVITDLKMPIMGGIELIKRFKKAFPDIPVIVITAFGSIESAVEAMKEGAFDYITKPFDREVLRIVVSKAIAYGSLRRENTFLREQIRRQAPFSDFIGNSPKMRQVYELAGMVAQTNSSVLITGESGTGKELLARTIHQASSRSHALLVAINCASIPDTLLESELFGYEKGAFTGADRMKRGKFEVADHGTLFMDEIGEMSPTVQAKLLRVLQERSFERLGGTKPQEVDIRLIAATNKNIQELVRQGVFREDLYYRINVFPIHIPTLRERRDDISLLAISFLKHFSHEMGKTVTGISDEALAALHSYPWPGNVREFQNVIERSVILCKDDQIKESSLILGYGDESGAIRQFKALIPPGGISLEEVEKNLIIAALEMAGYNQVKAARFLKITRNTLRYRMEKFGIPFTTA